MRLLVVGSVALDRLERARLVEHRLGGVAAYGGRTAVQLGWDVDAWAALPAPWVSAARRALAPVRLAVTPSSVPTRFVNQEQPGQERRQRCPSRAATLEANGIPFAPTERWQWIHFGPLHPADLDVGLLAALRERAGVVTVDLQGYARRVEASGEVVPEAAADLAERLSGVDWVKASELEWSLASAKLGLEADAALRHFGWRGLLVSAGERGGVLHTVHGATRWAAESAPHVVLETGAGDVFTAAFVVTLFDSGAATAVAPPADACDEALRFAARIAARHVAGEWLPGDALQLEEREVERRA